MLRYTLLLAAIVANIAPALIAPAWADDPPLFRPTRDVAVEYRSSGMTHKPSGAAGDTVTMRFASKTSRIRMDGGNGQGYAIIDTDAGKMTMVMAEKHLYMELPADPGMVAMFHGKNTSFVKTGSATIAGVPCTTYDAASNGKTSQVCISGDGVLLRARTADSDHSRELEAVKVTFEAQPASLFEPPADFQKMDMPAMPNGGPGAMGGGRPMGPPGTTPGGSMGR